MQTFESCLLWQAFLILDDILQYSSIFILQFLFHQVILIVENHII